jgi:hypothetical protein
MTNQALKTYRLPFGSDLLAPFMVDGVTRQINLASVHKVGAFVKEWSDYDHSTGHYAEIEFTLKPFTAPAPAVPLKTPVKQLDREIAEVLEGEKLRKFATDVRRTGLTKGRDADVAEAVRSGYLSVDDAMNTDD